MERIASLIHKLNEQYEQKADPALLLGTVQLIQFELTRINTRVATGLGTAKVAVMLPVSPVQQAVSDFTGFEKYIPAATAPAPAPVAVTATTMTEVVPAEPVQKKQVISEPFYDPMAEIPTLSNQVKGAEVNDIPAGSESLNDRLRQGKTELMETLKEAPVKDLRKAIGINDRFVFINELFRGDENMYERSIRTINGYNIYAEAEYWISRELKVKLGWDPNSETVKHFDQLVRRRFS